MYLELERLVRASLKSDCSKPLSTENPCAIDGRAFLDTVDFGGK